MPQQFYGTVTVNGGAQAPVNSEIRAQVNGIDRGTLITSVVGLYGGSGNFDPRLTVQATEADLSTPAVVTFYINGVKADQQVSDVPGSSSILNLTIGVPQTITTQPTTTTVVPTTTTVIPTTTTIPVTTTVVPTTTTIVPTSTTVVPTNQGDQPKDSTRSPCVAGVSFMGK